jgi:hypothetical protein
VLEPSRLIGVSIAVLFFIIYLFKTQQLAAAGGFIDAEYKRRRSIMANDMTVAQAAAALAGVKRPADDELSPTPARVRRSFAYAQCTACGGRTPAAEQLVAHCCMPIEGRKRYLCTILPGCTAKYASMPELLAHQCIHTGECPFKCDFPGCNKAFRSEALRTGHSKLHSESREHVCDTCSKAFRSRAKLDSHRRTHTGER